MKLLLVFLTHLCFLVFVHKCFAQLSPIISALENRKVVKSKKVPISGRLDEICPVIHKGFVYYIRGSSNSRTYEKGKRRLKGTMDLWVVKWDYKTFGKPRKLNDETNSLANDGPICFYDDGKKMILTRNAVFDRKKSTFASLSDSKTYIPLQLFSLELVDSAWTNIDLLQFNRKNYSYAHPTVNSRGDKMIFSSNNPKSRGGTDLFLSEYKNGKWDKPSNLGKMINTKSNEMFPLFIDDNHILFSSNGRNGPGKLDVYYTSLSEPNPIPLSFPVNSTSDDFGVSISEDKKHWLISSNRRGSSGMDDIYHLYVEEEKRIANPLAIGIKPDDNQLVGEAFGASSINFIDIPSVKWGFPNSYRLKDNNITYHKTLNYYYYEKENINDIYIISYHQFTSDDLKDIEVKFNDNPNLSEQRIGPYRDIIKAEEIRIALIKKKYYNSFLVFYKGKEPMSVKEVHQLLSPIN